MERPQSSCGSRTVFQKDLLCTGAIFKKAASFRGVRCEGKALFRESHFESKAGKDDFGGASFDEALDCEGSNFSGGANFNLLRCGFASFNGATFHNEAKLVDFTGASFQFLICSDATFRGPVTFYAIECKTEASFTNAKFQGETAFEDEAHRPPFALPPANFTAASFKHLDFSGVIFEGPVSFVDMECKVTALFIGARFLETTRRLAWKPHASVDFADASFRFLNCSQAVFKGQVRFYSVNCAVRAIFQEASFENKVDISFQNEVDFATASFNYLDCSNTTFQGRANFYDLKCADGARFHDASFIGSVDFSHAYFGSNLEFTSSYFDEVSLEEAKIVGKLDVTNAWFTGSACFYGAELGRLVFEPGGPKDLRLDLRECTFAWFTSTGDQAHTKGQALKLVESQDPTKFSSDPYVQLEDYFNKIGDRNEANKMYYKGRSDRRINAKDEHGRTQWDWKQKLGDWLLKVLSGYGVKTGRLFLIGLFFILLGTGVFAFWPGNSLVEVEASASSASGETLLASTAHSSEQSSYEWDNRLVPRYLVHRLAYSLDLFLPVVKLGLDEQWVPNGRVPQVYAFIHIFLGWLLVPLLLASLAGYLRRQS